MSVYFTNIKKIILDEILQAEEEILIAVAWLTDTEILNTLYKKRKLGITINIIIYDDRINKKELFFNLYNQGATIKLSKKLMHNKFCIIDRKKVINGSYNWTKSATSNNENIQITEKNPSLIDSFYQEFKSIEDKCESISKYVIKGRDYIIDEYNNFLNSNTLLNSTKEFPYFYIQKEEYNGYKPSNKSSKTYYLIQNKEEEIYLLRKIHFFINGVSNMKILKILDIPPLENKIKEYENIIELENQEGYTKSNYHLYTVELNNTIFQIDKYGNRTSTSYSIKLKLPNKYYLLKDDNLISPQFRLVHTDGKFISKYNDNGLVYSKIVTDPILKKITTYKYGLIDFNGNIIINFIYDNLTINQGQLIFYEYPIFKYDQSDLKLIRLYIQNNNSPILKGQKIETLSRKTRINENLNILKDKFLDNNNQKNINFIFINDLKKAIMPEEIKKAFNQFKPENDYKELVYFFAIIYNDFFSYKSNKLLKYDSLTLLDINSIISAYGRRLVNFKANLAFEFGEKREEYNKIHQIGKYYPKRNCYIATMVYGDTCHPQVDFLRIYRDQVILKYSLGKIFVSLYYKLSPYFVKYFNSNFSNIIIKKILDKLINYLKKHE